MSVMVKFNRGPMAGKRQHMSGTYIERIRVMENLPISWDPSDPYPTGAATARQGEYVRSHNKLKNGTVIYEWIGWLP
jgi:hypothetical protein